MEVLDLNSQEKDSVFALVYGASGTGKTHLMGTVGELGRVLLIDIDKGYKTIKFANDLQKYRKNITIVDFSAFEDLDNAYQLIKQNDPERWTKFFDPKGTKSTRITEPFDWVVWDTWSEIQWYMQSKLRSNEKLVSPGGKLQYRPNFQIQHWGALTDLNKLAIESLRDCPVNQIFTMQEKLEKDELSGQIYGGPAIHGKMVQEMPTYFDVVVHTYTDLSGNYCATNKAKGRWPGKTRLGVGQDYKNPTAKMLFT